MRVLDLFSGIGGFALGLERAGMQTIAFCEIDPYCRAVLAKHWPTVPIFEDVRALHATDVFGVDVICGGFPCQDISFAGKGAGLNGERSGLWREYARLIGEIRPRYVIVENVAALLGRGLGDVLGDLAALGYDAEWHCIPASYVGAPHRRDRLWIIANARGEQYQSNCASGERCGEARGFRPDEQAQRITGGGEIVADAKSSGRFEGREVAGRVCKGTGAPSQWSGSSDSSTHIPDTIGQRLQRLIQAWSAARPTDGPGNERNPGWWAIEPDVGRVAHGVLARAHRLRGLGNAVVPQIPELIGRAIMEAA